MADRLFGETSATKSLRLVETRALGDGVAVLMYEAVRDVYLANPIRIGRVFSRSRRQTPKPTTKASCGPDSTASVQ
jgi:hypothetical protein